MSRGRPREFDTESALERATQVFWQKGYRGTSLDDLTEAMNIGRPSLYSAFGDKEQLFLSVVDHYRAKYIVPNVVRLIEADDLHQALPEFLNALLDVICGRGCLIACLLSEEACESEVFQKKLSALITGADEAFASLFEKHKARLSADLSSQVRGRILTTALHGIATRARAGIEREELKAVGESVVHLLLKRS